MKRVVDFESFWEHAVPEVVLIVMILLVSLSYYLKF